MLRSLAFAAIVSTTALFAAPASATMIVSASGGGTGINTISAGCSAPSGAPGATIYGCLNTDHALQVRFGTTDEQIDFGAGGQAKIIPAIAYPPGFRDLSIGLVGHKFGKLIFNVEAQSDGWITFSDDLSDASSPVALSGAGSNSFTITGDNFSWIDLATTGLGTYGHGETTFTDGNIVDVKQVRFDDLDQGGGSNNPSPDDVPEPATLLLLAAGLAGFGALRRRKR